MRIFFSLLTALLLPAFAHAQYLSPEEVLLRDQDSAVVNREPDFQEYWLRSSSSTAASATASSEAGADTEDTVHEGPVSGGADSETIDDPVLRRLLDRLQNRHDGPAIGGTTDGTMPSTLHSGADLSDTGPGDIAVILTLGGAVAWTVYRGRKMKMYS